MQPLEVEFEGNHLDTDGLLCILNYLRKPDPKLQVLYLANTSLNAVGLKYIADLYYNIPKLNIKEIVLDRNRVYDESASSFFDAVKFN